MTTINEAQAVIVAEARRLTAAIRAKGFKDAHVEIWLNREHDGIGSCTMYVKDHPLFVPYRNDLAALIAETHEKIAALPHKDAEALAYAEELSGPLFLWSDRVLAEAAE